MSIDSNKVSNILINIGKKASNTASKINCAGNVVSKNASKKLLSELDSLAINSYVGIKMQTNAIKDSDIQALFQAGFTDKNTAMQLLKSGSKEDILKLKGICHTHEDILHILESNYSVEDACKLSNTLTNNKEISIYDSRAIFDLATIDIDRASFKRRLEMLNHIHKRKNAIPLAKKIGLELSDKLTKLENSINCVAITPTQVSKSDYAKAFSGFFANNNSELEHTLKTAKFTEFGINGLGLKYSRNKYLSDLTNLTKNLNKTEQTEIFNKLGITPILSEKGITGYDGIIDLTKLSTNGIESDILKLSTGFIKNNKIITGDEKLDEALNSLIQGFPEFVNIIGKKQHTNQKYSLDIHMLKVLQETINNKNYEKLSNEDKTCLKIASILHDIAKAEGVNDASHDVLSSKYAKNILDKSETLSQEMKDKIFELIANHHWLENYSNGKLDADNIATLFRKSKSYEMAKIIAEADIKSIGTGCEDNFLRNLSDDTQQPIQDALDKINSTGQIIFANKIIKPDLIPTIEYEGKSYKVIDFAKISDTTELSNLGFEPGSTKNNSRLFIHLMPEIDSEGKTIDIDLIDKLCTTGQDGYLSAAYSSAKSSKEAMTAKFNSKFGVSLEAKNEDIGCALYTNIGSGDKKGFREFVKNITDKNSPERAYVPNIIKHELNLSDSEYADLYKQIASRNYIGQIKDDALLEIGDKQISGAEIKRAIQKSNEALLDCDQNFAKNILGDLYPSTYTTDNNEVILFNPKINALVAKVDNLSKIPEEMLEYAQIKNLPIYFLGE